MPWGGLVGPMPADYLIELGGGLAPRHSLRGQLYCCRRVSAGDCLDTARVNTGGNGVGIPLSPNIIYLRSYQW